jgi:hypothetical protein
MANESNKNKGKINRNTYRIGGRRGGYGSRTLSGYTRTGRVADEPEDDDEPDEPAPPEPGTQGPCFAADEDSPSYNAAPPAADAEQGDREREREPQLPPLFPGLDFGSLSSALTMFAEGFGSALVEKPTTIATLLAGFAGHLAAKTDSERKPKAPKLDTSRMEMLVGMEDLAERLAVIEDGARQVEQILDLERKLLSNIHDRQCQMERAIDKLTDTIYIMQKDKKV